MVVTVSIRKGDVEVEWGMSSEKNSDMSFETEKQKESVCEDLWGEDSNGGNTQGKDHGRKSGTYSKTRKPVWLEQNRIKSRRARSFVHIVHGINSKHREVIRGL